MLFINKNTDCRLSEIGHNNFYYPSDKFVRISDTSEVTIMPWITFNSGYIPIKIRSENVLLDRSNVHSKYVVLWVTEDVLVREGCSG